MNFSQYCGGHFENGTGRNWFNVRINSGHHVLPTSSIVIKSDNGGGGGGVYCGGHFENSNR